MPRPVTDKNICRKCRLGAPHVEIRKAKGLPLGECRECHRKLRLRDRLKANFALGLYQSQPELVSANLKALGTLQPGAYTLLDVTTKDRSGYIVIKIGQIYVNCWNDEALFKRHWFEVASYIGNHGLFIDSSPIPVLGPDGETIALEAIGAGLTLENAADRLVWYDPVLMARAVQLVRDELRQTKASNMAIARRSNNPKPKP